jgi:hypothetical protein
MFFFRRSAIRKSEDNKNEENGKEVLHGKQQKRRKCGSD